MGIAGAGMSALALIARRRGVDVTGCDIDLRNAADVIRAGAEVFSGHDPAHVAEARMVIRSSAVDENHPELEAASDLGIPVLRRAEALGGLVDGARVVGVSGTHGKTTVTAMVTEALAAVGLHPTGIVGGRVDAWGGNARLDGDELFVVEADEYDRSFLSLRPTVAVVNNVEADHLECYGDLTALEDAFVEFAGRAEHVLVGGDDRGAIQVAQRLSVPVWRVGTGKDADIRVTDVEQTGSATRARVSFPDRSQVDVRLILPGWHNVRNAAMTLGVAHVLGVDTSSAAEALSQFRGVERRFQVLGTRRGVTVVDDYAHHPSEVVATLEAARQRFPGRRLVAVFQPHLFTRTKQHGEALGEALSAADVVIVTDVYPAREEPIPGVSGRSVADAAARAGAPVVEWIPAVQDLAPYLIAVLSDGDAVLTLGAGDITEVATDLLDRLAGAAA
jgi:UDP-N-acetylmuramate--alanine ligase